MKIALACRVEKGRRESGDDRALLPGRILEAGSWAGEASLPCAAAVCDGCGGYAGGGLAAETALSVLEQTPPEALSSPEGLAQALERAGEAVWEKKREFPQYGRMCTTIAGCVFCPEKTLIFHAGDSRVYRYDGFSLARMTVDHSMVQRMVEQGRMTEEEALVSPQRNIISRCIGTDSPPPELYISNVPIGPGEIFLLCSDGFWECMGDRQIKRLLSGGGDLEALAERLAAAALEAGSEDNITVCLCAGQGERAPVEQVPFVLD